MANSKKESCSHPEVYGSLCVVCGKEVSDHDKKGDYHTILHDNALLKMSKSNREKDVDEQVLLLRKDKQLVCILDLDQTILHCLIGKLEPSDLILQFHLENVPYNVYFRKHIDLLLKLLQSEYITHIYTMGTNPYCKVIKDNMASNYLFDVESRWMGRDLNVLPDEQQHMKSISRFNCPFEFSVVLDDRLEVWKQQENVVPILPYYHDLKSGDVHGSDRYKLHQNVVFRMDNHLVYVQNLLKTIHDKFYSPDSNGNEHYTSVPTLLKECLNIFNNCVFVLSGFIPNTKSFIPIINLIEKYGGVVMDAVDEKTTHCICMYINEDQIVDSEQFQQDITVDIVNDPNNDVQIIKFLTKKAQLDIKITEKVKKAKYKCFLLPPEWVYLSCFSYCRLDESVFNYVNMAPIKVQHAHNDMKNRALSESSLDSDLNSLADELEKN